MSDQTVSPDGVHVAGSFGAEGDATWWNPSEISLGDSDGDGIYSVTFDISSFPQDVFHYKFINGNLG